MNIINNTFAKDFLDSLRNKQKQGGSITIDALIDVAEVLVQFEKTAIMESYLSGKYNAKKGNNKSAEDYYNEKYNKCTITKQH
jgi:hypothetical protein